MLSIRIVLCVIIGSLCCLQVEGLYTNRDLEDLDQEVEGSGTGDGDLDFGYGSTDFESVDFEPDNSGSSDFESDDSGLADVESNDGSSNWMDDASGMEFGSHSGDEYSPGDSYGEESVIDGEFEKVEEPEEELKHEYELEHANLYSLDD